MTKLAKFDFDRMGNSGSTIFTTLTKLNFDRIGNSGSTVLTKFAKYDLTEGVTVDPLFVLIWNYNLQKGHLFTECHLNS